MTMVSQDHLTFDTSGGLVSDRNLTTRSTTVTIDRTILREITDETKGQRERVRGLSQGR